MDSDANNHVITPGPYRATKLVRIATGLNSNEHAYSKTRDTVERASVMEPVRKVL